MDPFDFPPTSRDISSHRAELDRWFQTLESLLAEVADEPELKEPLARIIASARARQEAEDERRRQALSSIDTLLSDLKPPPRRSKPHRISGKKANATLRSLEDAILRLEDGEPSDP